ncbi:MAG: phenylalanyl--tRNA ligase subunit alpha, partial [Candidatus Aenigmatarchaeota archaeon]
THENGWITGSKGWGGTWDPRRALRLILRTQTTAVSARSLYARGDGEYMLFSLDRVFRPENLDPKHSMEFYQLEGIIVGEKVTFRHLIGFFNEMARRLGLGKVMIKPAYFPFTEPSVEGFIKHPKLGWIEVFPGGMFRPELLLPLGIKKSNVAAWGIGVDRIAMTVLGIDDIRLLFTQDLDFIRNAGVPIIDSLIR